MSWKSIHYWVGIYSAVLYMVIMWLALSFFCESTWCHIRVGREPSESSDWYLLRASWSWQMGVVGEWRVLKAEFQSLSQNYPNHIIEIVVIHHQCTGYWLAMFTLELLDFLFSDSGLWPWRLWAAEAGLTSFPRFRAASYPACTLWSCACAVMTLRVCFVAARRSRNFLD